MTDHDNNSKDLHRELAELKLEITECRRVIGELKRGNQQPLGSDESTADSKLMPCRTLLDSAPRLVSVADAAGKLLYINSFARKLLGIGQDESILHVNISDCLTPQDFARLTKDVIPKILASGQSAWSGQVNFVSQQGASVSGMLHISPDGELLFQSCVAQDLMAHNQAEEALRESEARNRALVAAIPDLMFRMSRGGIILDFEPAAGIPPVVSSEVFMNRQLADVLPQDTAARMLETIARALDTETVQTLEYTLPAGGYLRHVEARAVICGYDEVLWMARDVTERKRAESELKKLTDGLKERIEQRTAELKTEIAERVVVEQALKASEAKYRTYLARSPYGVFVADADGNYVEANQTACEQTGYSHQELTTMGIGDVVAPECLSDALRDFQELKRTGSTYADYCFTKADGSHYCLSVNTSRISDNRFLGFTHDITERKRGEETRRQLDEEQQKVAKLQSIGMLAGGIAHDFNNYLTGILGNAELAKRFMRDGAQGRAERALAHIVKGCLRSQQLTQQLLTFAKGGAPVRKVVDLKQLLRQTCSFSLSGSRTSYECNLDSDLWSIEADEGQLAQVVQNILINADQAMPDGGIIEVVARNVIVGADVVIPLVCGHYVKLSFHDQGAGIADQYLSKLFEPYFTTKQRGSGLGLATSYAIVRKHGGYIGVDSKLGVGTTFHVYLPALDVDSDVPLAEPATLSRQTGRVLVLDDEDQLRLMYAAVLREDGHEVVLAANGTDAVAIFEDYRASGRPFELAILDLTIPGGMGGVATLAAIRKIDPAIKAIVASGYSTDLVLSDSGAYGFDEVLAKPFRIATLSEMVNALLRQCDGE